MTSPIVLAAGGTGGHIFPAEALAETLVSRGERVVLVTDKRFSRFEAGVLAEIEKRTIRAGSLKPGLIGKATGAMSIGFGILEAWNVLRSLKPKAVVGFGGYPSFPTVLAAARKRLPTLIHEQNAVLGRANRMLAGRVSRIATSFASTLMIEPVDAGKVTLTGNPVRAGVRAVHHVPYPLLSPDGTMQILVTGGSQGASVFSDIVPAALATLPAALRSRIRVDQQCREADIEAARAAYQHLSISSHLATFFHDMPARLAAAHLVIARAGASTVAELAVSGRPAILVPYPNAMDNHQYFNANAFEDTGGGFVMPQDGFTAGALSARLEAFLGLPSTLAKAAENARLSGLADAAERLADLTLTMAQ